MANVRSMSFSVNKNTLDSLTAYCANRGISRSAFMAKALDFYLRECLEDQEDYETAAAVWSEFEKSGGKTYSSDELHKEFDL